MVARQREIFGGICRCLVARQREKNWVYFQVFGRAAARKCVVYFAGILVARQREKIVVVYLHVFGRASARKILHCI